MMSRLALTGVLALGAASCASAQPPTTPPDPNLACSFAHPATSVRTLKDVPDWMRGYIHDHVGAMADAGAPFNATDVVTRSLPFNRFIRGGKVGAYWYLWFEHGGFAYWKQIDVVSPPNADGKVMREGTSDRLVGPTMCATTDAIVDTLPRGKS